MKCTNRYKKLYRKRRQKKNNLLVVFLLLIVCAALGATVYFLLNRTSITKYEVEKYTTPLYQEELILDTICVASSDVDSEHIQINDELHAAGLFQIDTAEVKYAENIHDKLYPASTTKLLTAYIALKYGNLDDVITISKNAVGVPLDSSRAGLVTGDTLTLKDLLYGLMLPSGNDSAVAIAEHISGSEAKFAELMNEEARKLGATNTHFINAHGYHDEDHYTTAYDLYLIINACVKNETFLEIVSTTQYPININQKNGTYRTLTWRQTNQFVNGTLAEPSGIDVIGGKTGTTDEAGACLVMYSESETHPYISIVMGADSKAILYQNMSKLISGAVNSEN